MVAIVVFMVIMIGGLNYFTVPQAIMAREEMKRMAVAAAQQRMETLLQSDYTEVTADSNETDTPVPLANISGLRTTTVTEIDDAADGLGGSDADGNTVDYKNVMVLITWSDGNSQSLSFTTTVSEFDNLDK
jgi:cytoskeletal protein RodZ